MRKNPKIELVLFGAKKVSGLISAKKTNKGEKI